jgi:hypothetical protein
VSLTPNRCWHTVCCLVLHQKSVPRRARISHVNANSIYGENMRKEWIVSVFLCLFSLGCGGGGTTSDGAVTSDAATDSPATTDGGASQTFACGLTLRCQRQTQYCEISSGGAKPRTYYQCSSLPTTCGPMPACSCFSAPLPGLCEQASDGSIVLRVPLA